MPARTCSKSSATPTAVQIRSFRKKVLTYYDNHGRDLPWRKKITPYRVLVSEIMLQQTQVERVIEKYKEFLAAFPDLSSLAKAPTAKLLKLWSGMGYNRRALALRSLAQKVMEEYKGKVPSDTEELKKLPGIGPYTAGAIAAFAFNAPVIFMDTNVRRVFIHEFFGDRDNIRDDELLPVVERALPRDKARTWYNALMDYGTMLKQEHGNPNKRSAHYTRQSPFENSNRQVRGAILKVLVQGSPLTAERIIALTGTESGRVRKNLLDLEKEGFISKKGKSYTV
ncbi:MAG: A/G-specific adenine glycosylase [Nitrospirota bacterium]|nr:A/G-specific adenine glycosylase [Nitrospirota bacterium]